jgi:hypothetical protein
LKNTLQVSVFLPFLYWYFCISGYCLCRGPESNRNAQPGLLDLPPTACGLEESQRKGDRVRADFGDFESQQLFYRPKKRRNMN